MSSKVVVAADGAIEKHSAKPPLPPIIMLYVLIAGMANLLFGYEMSIISGAKDDFAASHGLSQTGSEVAFLAAGNAVGASVGSAIAGLLQDWLGRRITLMLACVLYIGAVMVSFTSQAFPQLAGGRLLTGLAIGVFSSTVPMYIAELSPPFFRGRLVTVNQVCICTGVLLGYVAYMVLTPRWDWCLFAALPLAALLLFLFIFVTPYSPRWLLSKGRAAEARVVLLRIRGGDEAAVEREVAEIQQVLQQLETPLAAKVTPATGGDDEEGGTGGALLGRQEGGIGGVRYGTTVWQDMCAPHVAWAVTIGVMMALMQQWTGVNAVNAYTQSILQDAGFSAADSNVQSIFVGVSKLVFVIAALILMDKLGRRTMLCWGVAGMAVALVGLAVLLQTITQHGATPALSYSSAGCLFFYMAAFEASLGPVMWLLLSELFPLRVRGLAMSIGSTACWVFTVSVTLSFNAMKTALEASGVFYLFAGLCVASWLWMWMYVPETRGKSLEEIEVMLRARKTR